MKVTDIAFTGYPVTNMPRTRNFYEKKLGLSSTVYELGKVASWVEYECDRARSPSQTLILIGNPRQRTFHRF